MLFPTLFSLGGMTLVVLTRELVSFSDLVINRGLDAGLVASIALFQAVPLASQMLPLSVLVGALVGLGRMGADLEILVLEASGLSARRLVGPVLAFSLAMTVLAVSLSVWIAPWCSRSIDLALADVARAYPGAVVRPGVVQEFGQWKLVARQVSADGRSMAGVAMWFPRVGETIFAREAGLERAEDGATRLVMRDGSVLLDPRGKPRLLQFATMSTRLPVDGDDPFERSDTDRITGMTLDELWERGNGSGISLKNRREALVERQRRFSLPLVTAIFGVLALPLFLSRGHFSRSGGALLAAGAIIVYYGLVQVGNGLVQSGTIGPVAGSWLPNLALALIAIVLLVRAGSTSAFGRHTGRPQPSEGGWLARRLAARASRRAAAASGTAPAAAASVPPETGALADEPIGSEGQPIRVKPYALQRYIAGRFGQLALTVFLALLLGYLMVDVLERLQWFAKYDATAAEALRFYGFRIPLLASRVVPMALLVATALTVGILGVQGELLAIRACGIPAARALLPVLLMCAAIAPLSFVLNDDIVPRATAAADRLKDVEIKGRRPVTLEDGKQRSRRKAVWFRVGDTHYEADGLDPQQGTGREVTLYRLGPKGLPVYRLDARGGRHFGEGRWRLEDPVAFEVADDGLRPVPPPAVASLGEEVPAEVDTMHLSVAELQDEIDAVRADGYDPRIFEVDLFVKLAAPFACIVLPALVLFFCVSGPPYPTSALSLVVSAAIAVGFVLLTGVAASLGYGGLLPPWLAGSAPMVLFAGLAAWLGIRLRGFGQGIF